MAIVARFTRQAKRSYGVCIKTSAVAVLGLCFILVWSVFSSSYTSVSNQRSTFGEISQPISSNQNLGQAQIHDFKKDGFESDLGKNDKKRINGSEALVKKDSNEVKESDAKVEKDSGKGSEVVSEEEEGHKVSDEPENEEVKKENEEEEEGKVNGEVQGDDDVNNGLDSDGEVVANEEDQSGESEGGKKVKKKLGPLFDPKEKYSWKLCSTRSKHNYVPCIDIEKAIGRLKSYRHHERSCPKLPPMCLVPLPHEGYGNPVSWPESKLKVCVCFC